MAEQLFVFRSYAFDPKTGEISLSYQLDEYRFEETFTIPMEGVDFGSVDLDELDRALFALHLMAGVSYWKTFAPKQIVIESGSLTKEQATFWNTTYQLGLGEFFYQNNLDINDPIDFPVDDAAEDPELRGASEQTRDALVALGGGKDSIVTAELLKTHDMPFSLFVVKDAAPIRATGDQIGNDRILVSRTIAPELIDLNKRDDVYNGHVPITGILSFLSIIVAQLHKKTDVIFSLERTAEEGNLTYQGIEINHQYSKTLAFERAFQDYLASYVTKHVRFFSLLRPFSEFHIVKQFSSLSNYHSLFSSCNRNFTFEHTSAGKETFWCQQCPKCAFLFVMLSAWLPHARVVEMFGADLFVQDSLLDTYRELLGIQGNKPFECVGEAKEVAAAFELAYKRGDANESPAVQMYIGEARDRFNDPDATIKELLTPSEEHAIPEEYQPSTKTLYDAS